MQDIPSIKSLKKERILKDNKEQDDFKIVLKKCIEAIDYTHKYTKKTYCIFDVPEILIDIPNYNPKSCMLYIINAFKKKGYKSEPINKFRIYIEWTEYNTATIKDTLIKDPVEKISKLFPKAKNIKYVYE
jgi:hypothetical protein